MARSHSRRPLTPRGRRRPARRKKSTGRGNEVPPVNRIIDALRKAEPRGLRPKELARIFALKGNAYRALRDKVKELERNGRLLKLKGGRYAPPSKNRRGATGVLSMIRSGAGFVALERGGPDVYVAADALGTALHGDTVEVEIEPERGGRRASAQIVRVVERSRDGLVGVFRGSSARRRRPGTPGPRVDVSFPGHVRTFRVHAQDDAESTSVGSGDVVVVRLDGIGKSGEPIASVQEVLGDDSDPRVDSLRVIRQFGLSETFPERVTAEALAWLEGEGHRGADAEDRADHTDLHVLTIDPADARDHDDALSVLRGSDGSAEVGVHIADVSFYVRPGSAIDREAQRRGTSVYLVDRAVPMLPEALSSDTCSLKSGTRRRAISLFFRLTPAGALRSWSLQRTWIQPQEVLSYEAAQAILDGEAEATQVTVDSLHTLRDLAEILRLRRENRGALDFDLPEAQVVLSPDGTPAEVRRRERLEAHRIIEEWMLAANELIAQQCREHQSPMLYRVHEAPDSERTETLSVLAATYGHDVPRAWTARSLQGLLEATRGEPEEGVIHNAVLRAMKRARYDAQSSPHFGLAVEPYAHFTSPIRRYPDLQLHQMLDGTLLPHLRSDDDANTGTRASEHVLEELAVHTTARERVADDAGRESVELAKMRYLEQRIGDEFTGRVTRALTFGFFVVLDEAFVEGLVHLRTLDDHYRLHESSGVLVGERTGRTFRVGDAVTIRVARVDRLERQIDFELIVSDEPGTAVFDTPGDRQYRRPSDRKARHSDR